MNAKELLKRIEKLEVLEQKANQAMEAREADLLNEELEKLSDKAYEAQYYEFMAIADELVKMLNISIATAREMVREKRIEVKNILQMAA